MTGTINRAYRFAPLDRAGWLLGLSGTQCIAGGGGVAVAAWLASRGAPLPLVMGALLVGLGLAFATLGGTPVRELAPVAARFGLRQGLGGGRWLAEVPLTPPTGGEHGGPPLPLPAFLAGLTVVDAAPSTAEGGSSGSVGVVIDRVERTISVTIPVAGPAFTLTERADQERTIAGWGDVLAGFCADASAVVGVRVTETARPCGPDEHASVPNGLGNHPRAVAAYSEVLADAAGRLTRHETLLTITVAAARIGRRSARANIAGDDPAVGRLMDAARSATARLRAAGFDPSTPLPADQLVDAIRLRCDPAIAQASRLRRLSLAELAGAQTRLDPGPLAVDEDWTHVRCDGSVHRSFWIAGWPRLEVGPSWAEPLLTHQGAARTITIDFVPVPVARSLRTIERDATRLAADESQRVRAGFRVGARHRRSEEAVVEREAELVGGYAELEYAGFLTVSADAADLPALDEACGGYEHAAARAGLELRALHGRHDLGLLCSLPVGRGVARSRWS